MVGWSRHLQIVFKVGSSNTYIFVVNLFLLYLLYLFSFLLFDLLYLISKVLYLFQMLVNLLRKLIVKVFVYRCFFIAKWRFECFYAFCRYLIFGALFLSFWYFHELLHCLWFCILSLIFEDIRDGYSAEVRLVFENSLTNVWVKRSTFVRNLGLLGSFWCLILFFLNTKHIIFFLYCIEVHI